MAYHDAPVHTILALVLSTTVDILHLGRWRGQGNGRAVEVMKTCGDSRPAGGGQGRWSNEWQAE